MTWRFNIVCCLAADWTWVPAVWRTSTALMFSGRQRRSAAFLPHSERHAAGSEVATETDIPASGGIHSSVDAEAPHIAPGKHCTVARHVRVLRPLQSAAP
jgi:hypothetical protein